MRTMLLCLPLAFCLSAGAQTMGGSWYGTADPIMSGGNNYLTELILKQKGDDIEGIFGFYFRNGYKSSFVRGKYNKASRAFIIRDVPITYFRSESIDGVDCVMDLRGTLMVSKVSTSLKGSFSSDDKYRYTCPELVANFNLDAGETTQDSLIRHAVARKLWQPREEDVILAGSETAQADTEQAADTAMHQLAGVFASRQTVLVKEIEVESDSVRISFYDNGDIDQDSISVFLNRQPIVVKQELTASALNIYIALDKTKPVNEISMYAENLGSIPPNTALMIVNDGKNRHEVYLSSSLTQNAAVRLKRKRD